MNTHVHFFEVGIVEQSFDDIFINDSKSMYKDNPKNKLQKSWAHSIPVLGNIMESGGNY